MGSRGQPTKWDAWYSSGRWARIRKQQLLAHPLCHFCLERGIVTPATIRDHVEPHHGDVNKFWLGKLQSLCKTCHDGAVSARSSYTVIAATSGLMAIRSIRIIRYTGTNARKPRRREPDGVSKA